MNTNVRWPLSPPAWRVNQLPQPGMPLRPCTRISRSEICQTQPHIALRQQLQH